MPLSNASRLADFGTGIGTAGAIIQVDNANQRLGVGTTAPAATLGVAGIVSATAFYGDGSNLDGVASAGLGTALSEEEFNPLTVIYQTSDTLSVGATITVDPPDATTKVAYTQYADIRLEDDADLIIADGDDFIPDILGLSTEGFSFNNANGNGVFDTVFTDNIERADGRGAPNFPKGLTLTGVSTFTGSASFGGNVSVGGTLTYEDVTNVDSVGLITARSGVVDSTLTSGRILIAGASGRLTDNNNLKFDGSRLDIDSSAQNVLQINSTNSDGPSVPFQRSGSALAYLGSAAAAISGGTATDFSIRSEQNLVFASGGGSERLRITSDGYIHAGNTGYGTNKVGGQAATGEDFDPYFKLLANSDNHWLMQLRSDTSTGSNGIFMRAGNNSNNYSMYITGRDETTPHLITRGDGNVLIGTTSSVTTNVPGAEFIYGNGAELRCGLSGTGNGTQIRFYNGNGEVGAIRTNGSSTVYHTSSDYRLKENAVIISDVISKVKQLKPYTFNFKADSSIKIDGFFAHEAQEVVPYAVSGEKDGEEMQSMDYGKLTPLLTAALQEAISEIETLKTEVAALKSQLNN